MSDKRNEKNDVSSTVIMYEYKITEEGDRVVKIVRESVDCSPNANGGLYIVRKKEGKRKVFVFGKNLDKVERNVIYSLEDNYEKFADIIIKAYKEKTEQLQRQLDERKRILDNLLRTSTHGEEKGVYK